MRLMINIGSTFNVQRSTPVGKSCEGIAIESQRYNDMEFLDKDVPSQPRRVTIEVILIARI